MRPVPTIKECTWRVMAIVITFLTAIPAIAQKETGKEGLFSGKMLGNTKEIIRETENFIEHTLDEKDSLYVSPDQFNLTVMPQYSYCYEYYRFSGHDSEQSITLAPDNSNKVGLYLGWRWIFLGYSFDISGNSPQTDLNFSFYTAAVGIDLFYRERNEGYRVRKLNGFYQDNNRDLTDFNRRFDGLTVKQRGMNLYYIFNNRRFSYRAAYSHTTNQRISTGSFILGLTYNEQSFLFDHSKFDIPIREQIDNELKFENVRYKDFSINFGYSYNWVFAKDFLANISMTPAVGYKNTSLNLKSSKEFLSSINFDLITRAAVVYNNSRYYAGASLVAHTYSYNKSTFSILNGFGVINVYFGVNFWRRK